MKKFPEADDEVQLMQLVSRFDEDESAMVYEEVSIDPQHPYRLTERDVLQLIHFGIKYVD